MDIQARKLKANLELLNRVAIVTGSGRGIGEAVALAFAENGATVVLVSRTESDLEKVAATLKNMGASASIYAGDVSQPKDVDRIIDGTVREHGRIDILVNAAAIHGPIGQVWECDAETWSAAVQVNLIGTFLCCRKVIPHMLANRWGRIINFSGGGATAASPFLSAYGASKAAIVRLTETLAAELMESGVQVNAIAPGLVDTRIHDDLLSAAKVPREMIEPLREMRENGRGSVPKELPARLAVFLASSRSSGLSGKLIAAPYDNWQAWNEVEIRNLMSAPWLTLRRMDTFTVSQFSSSPANEVKA